MDRGNSSVKSREDNGKMASWFNVRDTVQNEAKNVDLQAVKWKAFNQEEVNLADLDTNCEASSNQLFLKNAKTELDKLRHLTHLIK